MNRKGKKKMPKSSCKAQSQTKAAAMANATRGRKTSFPSAQELKNKAKEEQADREIEETIQQDPDDYADWDW
jgi:hypothetical protein